MSFTLQTGVTLDTAPLVLERCAEGSPRRAMATSLRGSAIVTEWPDSQAKRRLKIAIEYLSDSQRQALETALNTVGVRTVYTGSETVTCIPGDRSEQKFEELVAPFPDKHSDNSTPAAGYKVWRAEIVFYRMS
jgi:hypothetical protein